MEKIGVDIVKNSRFYEFIDDYRKLGRILSNQELEFYSLINNEKRKLEYIASRFASKEALYKAGITNNFNNISILNDDSGKPYVLCDTNKQIEISLSHEDEYSIAFVLVK